MTQLGLFPDDGIPEQDRLYVIGNGFDIHHGIESKYCDFRKWVLKDDKNSSLVGLMDIFFSNDREFWGDIEKALGEYNEKTITDFCEPDNPDDFKYDHPSQWQDGVEGSIPWIFGETMDKFRSIYYKWVKSISIKEIEPDLFMPQNAKYLSFNYTETLEKYYGIPVENVLHIHGSRTNNCDEFVIGHNNQRDEDEPLMDEELLFPYQNAYSSVIRIMNEWKKDSQNLIDKYKSFFQSLNNCKGVCVLGLSYSDIDIPYLNEIADTVASDCKWLLYYHTEEDKKRAIDFAKAKELMNYTLKNIE